MSSSSGFSNEHWSAGNSQSRLFSSRARFWDGLFSPVSFQPPMYECRLGHQDFPLNPWAFLCGRTSFQSLSGAFSWRGFLPFVFPLSRHFVKPQFLVRDLLSREVHSFRLYTFAFLLPIHSLFFLSLQTTDRLLFRYCAQAEFSLLFSPGLSYFLEFPPRCSSFFRTVSCSTV